MWILMVLGLFVLFLLLLVLRERIGFYKRGKCSVCGKETGVKGNKRYGLQDGAMCQACAEKFFAGRSGFGTLGSNAFAHITVAKVQEGIQHRAEVGEEQYYAEYQERLLKVRQEIEAKKSESVRCPKCGSTQITANQKGFSVGKAIAGTAFAGETVGLIAGASGSKKVIITCLKCGHQWRAGQHRSW